MIGGRGGGHLFENVSGALAYARSALLALAESLPRLEVFSDLTIGPTANVFVAIIEVFYWPNGPVGPTDMQRPQCAEPGGGLALFFKDTRQQFSPAKLFPCLNTFDGFHVRIPGLNPYVFFLSAGGCSLL